MNHNSDTYRDRVNIANILLIQKREMVKRFNMIYWWSDYERFSEYLKSLNSAEGGALPTRLEQLLQVRYFEQIVPVDLLLS
jgi:hypothetical protein